MSWEPSQSQAKDSWLPWWHIRSNTVNLPPGLMALSCVSLAGTRTEVHTPDPCWDPGPRASHWLRGVRTLQNGERGGSVGRVEPHSVLPDAALWWGSPGLPLYLRPLSWRSVQSCPFHLCPCQLRKMCGYQGTSVGHKVDRNPCFCGRWVVGTHYISLPHDRKAVITMM